MPVVYFIKSEQFRLNLVCHNCNIDINYFYLRLLLNYSSRAILLEKLPE